MGSRTVFLTQGFTKQAGSFEGNLKRQVFDFLTKINGAESGGLDLKKPVAVLDNRVRTARVNRNFRAVLVDMGANTFGLVAVMPHDDAYAFAGRLRVDVNPATGAIDFIDQEALDTARRLADSQVRHVQVENVPAVPGQFAQRPLATFQVPEHTDQPSRLLGLDPQVLVGLGVDAPTAQGLVTLPEQVTVEKVADSLPTVQGLIVLDLLAGRSVDEIREDYVTSSDIDRDDLFAAAQRTAKRRLGVLEINDPDVEAAMSGDLAAWRVWLHPSQKRLVEHRGWNGPYRVTGSAGTGKTVTAVHRAVWLARELERQNHGHPGVFAPVLMTTYTKNLATTIGEQIDTLAGQPLAGQGIEVRTVDAVARSVLMLTDVGRLWLENSRLVGEHELREFVERAVAGTDLDENFLREEWEEVILVGAVRDKETYLSVPRIGRSQRLSRRQRLTVWKATQRLTNELELAQRWTWRQVLDRAALVLQEEPRGADLVRRLGVRHVIVDEAQDLTAAHWRLLRALVPQRKDDIFIVGDSHQRIYGRHVPLSRFGIETRGRSKRLTINYRTSRQIFAWSLGVVDQKADDLDEGTDSMLGARSIFSGHAVERPGFDGLPEDPDEALLAWIRRVRKDMSVDAELASSSGGADTNLSSIAVVRATRNGVDETLARLREAGLAAVKVDDRTSESALPGGIRVMTMHRAKGLEYRAVAVRDASAENQKASEAQGGRQTDPRTRLNLLYVAATRARERLLVC